MTEHRYFDGRVAMPHRAALAIGAAAVEILDHAGRPLASWPFALLRVADQNAVSGSFTLRLEPDAGARLEIAPGADLDVLLACRPELRRWRARERGALLKGFVLWGAVGALLLAGLYLGWTRAALLLASWIPSAWEEHVGTQIERAWFPQAQRCSDDAALNALRTLGGRLWPEKAKGREIRLFVVRDEDVNAFAVPGHRIVVFSGLIEKANSPEMVAAVLAHEMGHAELRHPMRGLIHQLGLGAVLTLVFGDSSLAGVGQVALTLSYSRDMEREADRRGIELLREAGIRADGMAEFFSLIKDEMKGGLFDGLPEFLSTHPNLDERIAATRQPSTGAPAMSDVDWQALRKVCDAQ